MMPKKPLSYIPKVSYSPRRKRARSPQDIFLIFRISTQERLQLSLQMKVLPAHWDQKRQRFKNIKEHPEYEEYNRYLEDLARVVKDIYRHAEGQITAAEMKRQLTEDSGEQGKERFTFFTFIEDYLQRRSERVDAKRGTEKVLKTVFNLLKEYVQYWKEDLDFDDIDRDFAENFKRWLYQEKNHSVNYVKKIFSVLRQFMRAANQEGHTTNTVFNHNYFTERKIPTAKVALTIEEIDLLRAVELEGLEALVRDYFLIGCYTGMRYSDYSRLTREHITREGEETLIRIYARKTNTYCVIPCFPELLEILERYNFQLPEAPVNQVMNRYLKAICRKAGINKPREVIDSKGGQTRRIMEVKYRLVSTHTARRTFATLMYLTVGLPSSQVMRITGHATERQFLAYIDFEQEIQAIDIARHFKEFKKSRNKK